MPKHDISAALPAHRVVNTDLSVTVNSDGQRLGELLISKGTLDWRAAKHQYTVSMRWETFARLMERWNDGELK
jgi:hypothetical protein